MNSRKDVEIIRAYQALLSQLRRAGIFPKKHVMDNEILDKIKNIILYEYKIRLELVPPGCHQRNAAEVVIIKFKSHFLILLAGGAYYFPLQLWDSLLPQTEIKINLL